jgi:hypothetical protein
MSFNGGHLSGVREIAFLATAAFGIAVAGCSDVANSGEGDSNVVTSRVAFALPGGSNISSVSYRVLSSENATLALGTIDVGNPGATLSLDLVLAPGIADVVELSATTSTGASCAGTSAPFEVVVGQPTFVNLTLVCGGDQPSSASCPDIQSWVVTPVQAQAPFGMIDVGVTAIDPDATDLLSYAWTATAGAFLDPFAPSTLYTCATVGAQTLTLAVGGGGSLPLCIATASFLVNCVSSGDAGSPPPSVVSAQLPGRP